MKYLKLDAFELLYIAISIATFSHTMWAAAFVFEGLTPVDPLQAFVWYSKGALIAIAVDVGMFTTSRSLLNARGISILFLVVAFMIAAVASFYTQLVFLLAHTPEYIISPAVSAAWIERLQPITNARILLFPAILPGLAAIYTLARIFKTKDEIIQQQLADETKPIVIRSTSHLVEVVKEQPELLEATERLSLPEGETIDWEKLTFWDPVEGKWRGPYKSKRALMTVKKTIETRRERRNEKRERKVKSNGKLSPSDVLSESFDTR